MPIACRAPAEPRYRGLFPDWTGLRPVRWHCAEELLEARHASRFPTNAEGFDEDVNIYLVGLLTGLLSGPADPRVMPGADPLLLPPAKDLTWRTRAGIYRVNGDHRLLSLGLWDRGDTLRRRRVPLGMDAADVRPRDQAAGRACYAMAANIMAGRPGAPAGLVAVLAKLADNFEEYAHVLAVLATRRWGLGARLGDGELAGLLRATDGSGAPPAAPACTMDELLDAVAAWRNAPSEQAESVVRARAAALGVDPARCGLGG